VPADLHALGTDDDIEARVRRALSELDVPNELIACDPGFADTAAFCEHYGVELADSANTILVGSRKEPRQFCACVALATTRLDVNRRVCALMGVRKASFASAEETMSLTGMMIGGVTPLALPADLPLYVDARVMTRPSVVIGGGTRSLKIRVSPQMFPRLPGCTVVDGLAAVSGT
jgi:prolyl-tRNA editing enzyme YbaK/EbsC (Cys-tRNA(Pro) deacylase)